MTVNCICKCEADTAKKKTKKHEEERLAKIKENCKMPGIFWNADFSEIEDEKKLLQILNCQKCRQLQIYEEKERMTEFSNHAFLLRFMVNHIDRSRPEIIL